jgi:inorganic pyrophosphatase
MTDYQRLPLGPRAPEIVNAVVEIPARSRNKYEYDELLGIFRLDRTLYSPVEYPFEYGFFPSTRGGDGDALDLLLLTAEPTFPGCVVEVRPVARLGLRDQAGEDAKILVVPSDDPRFTAIRDLKSVPPHTLREIEQFFRTYAVLEGKRKIVKGWTGRAAALREIRKAADRFRRESAGS